jgi:hypothetical protein
MKVSLALTRPAFPLPVAPVWSGCPWAFPPMLRTPPLPATHVRVGTDHEHFSGAHCRLHPDPPVSELTRTVRPHVAVRSCLPVCPAASVMRASSTKGRPCRRRGSLPTDCLDRVQGLDGSLVGVQRLHKAMGQVGGRRQAERLLRLPLDPRQDRGHQGAGVARGG